MTLVGWTTDYRGWPTDYRSWPRYKIKEDDLDITEDDQKKYFISINKDLLNPSGIMKG